MVGLQVPQVVDTHHRVALDVVHNLVEVGRSGLFHRLFFFIILLVAQVLKGRGRKPELGGVEVGVDEK